MLRTVLTAGWGIAVVFFIWEFLAADSLPAKYAKANPWAFRVIDILFLVWIGLTIYYFWRST